MIYVYIYIYGIAIDIQNYRFQKKVVWLRAPSPSGKLSKEKILTTQEFGIISPATVEKLSSKTMNHPNQSMQQEICFSVGCTPKKLTNGWKPQKMVLWAVRLRGVGTWIQALIRCLFPWVFPLLKLLALFLRQRFFHQGSTIHPK